MHALLKTWWPFHWIDLTLRERNGDSFLFKLFPDCSANITANFKGIEGVGYPKENLIVYRRLCKVDDKGFDWWIFQNFFVLFGNCY